MFNYKNVLIYGYSTSGKAVEKALIKLGVKYKIYDDNILINGGNYLKKIDAEVLKNFDLIVISPGVSIYNKNVKLAEKLGIKVVSELEFGFWFCDAKIIAVTGTNGKTTTVSLLKHILLENGFKTQVFGNIGEPLTNIIWHEKLDYVIIEVSSFQLEAIYKFRANIGIILNIDEDHLDRHKTLENYIKAKFELFKNCKKNDIAILNVDDNNIIKKEALVHCKKYFLSEFKIVEGAFCLNGEIMFNEKESTEKIVSLNELEEVNTFTINILAVLTVAKILNCDMEKTLQTIKSFKWLPNRMEEVAVINGVKYINDSKGTNVHASYYAITKVKGKVIVILGGQDKDLNFNSFFKNLPDNVVNIIFYGKARYKIYKASKPYYKISRKNIVKSLPQAVKFASILAQENEVVLFSPACASFDYYSSYKERGEHFKKIVNELKNQNFDDNFAIKKIEKNNIIRVEKVVRKNNKN